ncbi:MAG: hypothetical protein K2K67_08930 [Treponemataceae bacterium]|nr:hypothetical protein [Treponemataceae bacterium]
MRICKRFCAALLFCPLSLAFSQSNTKGNASPGISMPSITAPSMPTVTVPHLGGGFYTPVAPKAPVIDKSSATVQEQTTVTPSDSVARETQRATAKAAGELGLTATDLTSMDQLGLLSSGILGGSSLSALKAATAKTTPASADSLLLQQILAQLTELKAQLEKQDLPAAAHRQETAANRKILRFVVNGYDVLATCRDVYFSVPETDGSFLLTGDRKYLSNGANRSETFHLLFAAKAAENRFAQYGVTAAVTQDYTNEYSFLYQLAERQPLTAQRTGNFVSLRVNDPDWKLDLLVALDG